MAVSILVGRKGNGVVHVEGTHGCSSCWHILVDEEDRRNSFLAPLTNAGMEANLRKTRKEWIPNSSYRRKGGDSLWLQQLSCSQC